MSTFRKYLTLLVISLGGGTIYIVPYFKYNYYDQILSATHLTNEQLGMLLTVYGTLAIFFYIPGGLIADRFSARNLFTFSMVTTGLLTFWYATLPGYTELIIIHLLMSVTSVLTFWSAFLKGIRMLGNDDEQGRLYGISDSMRCVAGLILSFIALYLMGLTAENQALGVSYALVMFGAVYVAIGILSFLLMPKESAKTGEQEGLSMSSIKSVLSMSAVYLISINIFFWHCAYGTITFAVPYLKQAFGLSDNLASTVGILRMYFVAIFIAPISGFLADKMGSPSRLLQYLGYIGLAICMLFIFVPTKESLVMLMIAATLGFGTAVAAARGVYYATMAETKIPLATTGLATGIISIIGYSSDIFMHPILGWFLDKFEVVGFKYIFIWMALCTIGAIATATIIQKKVKQANK